MDRHDVTVTTRQHVTDGRPDVLAFALLRRRKSHGLEALFKGQHPGAVIPDNDVVLLETLEECAGMAELLCVRPVEADDDPMEVGDF